MQKQLIVWTASAGLLSAAVSARGAGFDLPDQDAFVVARGMAFVATADNPSAIYYNPAGISQLSGHNVRGGIYGIYLKPSYEPFDSDRRFDNKNDLHVVPQLFYTYKCGESPLSLGVGLYSPFGLGLRWAEDTGFRTIGTQSKLKYVTLNPVAALQLSPTFSIGGGVTLNYSTVDLQQGLVWPEQPNDRFRFKGDGWDVGYNLGALWQVHEKVFLGATFRSSTQIEYKGHSEARNRIGIPDLGIPEFNQRTRAEGEFPFPLKAIFGISYRPTPKWNLEFNADYTDWDALGTVTIKQATPLPLVGQDIDLALEWESSWYYEFGVTRYFENGWHVSGGYIYNENSVPDANYTPLVTDLDRHFWSVGTGCKGQRFDFDIAYQFGWGPPHKVSGSAPSAAGQRADGRYEFFSHAVAVSVGMRF